VALLKDTVRAVERGREVVVKSKLLGLLVLK